jgi:PilZ domain
MTETSTADEDRRRWPRRTVLWPAKLQLGPNMHDCWVRNISASGAAVQADVTLGKQQAATLHLERHGSFDAFVIWTGGKLHGLAFVSTPEHIIQRFGDDAETLGML